MYRLEPGRKHATETVHKRLRQLGYLEGMAQEELVYRLSTTATLYASREAIIRLR